MKSIKSQAVFPCVVLKTNMYLKSYAGVEVHTGYSGVLKQRRWGVPFGYRNIALSLLHISIHAVRLVPENHGSRP